MVTFTILSNTEGGPTLNVEDTAVDGAAAAAMLRRAAMLAAGAEAADRRAILKRQEESIIEINDFR